MYLTLYSKPNLIVGEYDQYFMISYTKQIKWNKWRKFKLMARYVDGRLSLFTTTPTSPAVRPPPFI